MSNTTNLQLPYLAAAQAQKHVTLNESLRNLDALVQLAVLNRTLAAPPPSPAEGDRHIVAASATDAWTGHDSKIAAWQDGAWMFYQPRDGWVAWCSDEAVALVWSGSAWDNLGLAGTLEQLGINASADASNRLTVKSDASLFTHDDVTPGSGDHQMKINKAGSGNTASMLFQTNWSGRAEFGLAGDDDWHVKVSSDGSIWREALVVDSETGMVSFPQAPVTANMIFNLFKDAGRFAGSPEPNSIAAATFEAPTYLAAYNGASFAAGDKFIDDNTTYGGSAGALGSDVDGLIQKIRDTGASSDYGRYGPEFFVMDVTAGAGTTSPEIVGPTTYYMALANASVPTWARATVGFNMKVKSGEAAIVLHASRGTYMDGTRQASSFTLAPADGWKQIVHRLEHEPRQFVGYDDNVFRIYATPGSVIALALPFHIPGWAPISTAPYGLIGSLEAWS